LNAVEIEEAISQLADQPFDAANFSYAFLEAFGNEETTIKRLRGGASNKSDLGGVLQTDSIQFLIVTVTIGYARTHVQTDPGDSVRDSQVLFLGQLGSRLVVHRLAAGVAII